MEISAAVVEEDGGEFHIQSVTLEDPRDNEVLIRIVGAGVCHTDLICRDQWVPVPLPAVFGHEGAGIVERVGSNVDHVAPGDHVVLSFDSCGSCPSCFAGSPAYCHNISPYNFSGARPDGTSAMAIGDTRVSSSFFGQSSFATHSLAQVRNTVKIDKELPIELLGPLGCGIQTGAGAVMNTLAPAAGTSIAVFGVGSVGLSAIMAANLVGCATIIAVDVNPSRLETAKELGATHTINPTDSDPVEAIRELTKGGADYSLEATALPKVFRQAVDCLTVTGTCGLIGAPKMGEEATFDMWTILLGRTVRGVVEGDSIPGLFIPRLAELYRQGRFPFDKLIKQYDFAQINAAVRDAEAGAAIKPVLIMPG